MVAGGTGRMDEYNGLAGIEVGPDWCEGRVAEIRIATAIAGHQDHSVRLERIEGIVDLLQSRIRFKEIGHRSKEAITLWLLIAHFGAELVTASRQLLSLLTVWLDFRPWSGTREDGGLDAYIPASGLVGVDGPRRDVLQKTRLEPLNVSDMGHILQHLPSQMDRRHELLMQPYRQVGRRDDAHQCCFELWLP